MLKKNKKIVSALKPEGEGAEVKRLFPSNSFNYLDPFVLLDHFYVEPPNEFAPHEHRGFEAITYMLEGSFLHSDNLGNEEEIPTGGVQAFNAGRGIVHSEAPGGEGLSRGIQLWINIPKPEKESEPGYQKLNPEDIPRQKQDNLDVRTIVGPGSPLKLKTEVIFQEVKIKETGRFNIQLSPEHQGVIYLLAGELTAESLPVTIKKDEGYLLTAGSSLELESSSAEAQFIFLAGRPLGEPIKIKGSSVE